MMLTQHVAAGVANGEVTVAFRRWETARVKAGNVFHSSAGLVEVRSVAQIDESALTASDARAAGSETLDDLRATFTGSQNDPIFRIELAWGGPDPRDALSADVALSEPDIDTITRALARLDRRNPWTIGVLQQIRDHPGKRAADLAADLGREKLALKLDIRKLKNLGLTRSLPVGYEISARGQAYLDLPPPPTQEG